MYNTGKPRWIDRGVDSISDPGLRLLLFGESETPLVLCERHWRRVAAGGGIGQGLNKAHGFTAVRIERIDSIGAQV